jgi:hypothetical protein
MQQISQIRKKNKDTSKSIRLSQTYKQAGIFRKTIDSSVMTKDIDAPTLKAIENIRPA